MWIGPLKVTDFGSQSVSDLLTNFHRWTTIQYLKQENGKDERTNKEANCHAQNILLDIGHLKNWSWLLCTTERVLNNLVKQPLGVSPNMLLFDNAFLTDPTLD